MMEREDSRIDWHCTMLYAWKAFVSQQMTLPVSYLPQGLFFVTIQGGKTAKAAKLVITR
jgi:hypothetical protein